MKKNLLCAAILLSLLVGLTACGGQTETMTSPLNTPAGQEAEKTPETVTILDGTGREVEIVAPLTRVAVVNRYDLELLRACGQIVKVVGVDDSIIENAVYWPEFAPENSFGDGNELNYEAIAELEPQALITPFVTDDLVAAMEPFGIPVVGLVGYNVELNGQIDVIESLFGPSEDSASLRAFFNEVNDTVAAIAAAIPEAERKSAVWESIKDYSVARSGNDWGKMIERAGGVNAFADAAFDNTEIDAESFIVANPDYLFKMVAGTGLDLSGYTPPSEEDYLAAQAAYLARPGFQELSAVHDGNVRFVTSFAMGGMGKLIGTAYIAKWLYPDRFETLDPDAVFGRWLEEFQHISFTEGQSWRVGDHINGNG